MLGGVLASGSRRSACWAGMSAAPAMTRQNARKRGADFEWAGADGFVEDDVPDARPWSKTGRLRGDPHRSRSGRATVVSADADVTPALPGACGRQAAAEPGAWSSSRAGAATAQDARSLLRQWRRRLPDAHRRRDVADPVGDRRQHARDAPAALGARLPRATRPESLRGEPCGARSHGTSRCGARPGKGILGRIRPSLPRRPYEDGHLLQLERCHDVQQHSGGLAAGGGGGHAPRRRVDWPCGSACRRWPGARSGAAC